MDRIGGYIMNIIERVFESILWNTRFFVLLAVVFSMVGGIVLFIVASDDIINMTKEIIDLYINSVHKDNFHEMLVSKLIGAIDLYLMAIVMFIFGFGLYELFISKIDIAEESGASKILEIHSLDQLKDKLAKVIIMVLIVSFFKRILHTEYTGALEMFYFALSIFALALSLYFMHKNGSNHE